MSYLVFLSYSHKDAEIYGHEYILALKHQIELSLGGSDVVFLDTEALHLGNEWNSKIKSSLHNSQVFICLLSENYINSEYCTRERLWWAQKEMKNGRLHQAMLPIYYIEIESANIRNSDTWQKMRHFQSNAVPWFPDGAQMTAETLIKNKLDSAQILTAISRIINNERVLSRGCTTIPPYNQNFVGRINEMRDIRQICLNRGMTAASIPVIHGEAGCGKSELALAYAHGYACEYPGGSFFIPMENIQCWSDAWLEFANQSCRENLMQVSELLGLTAEDQKQPPEKYAGNIARAMWKYIKSHGQTLLLLDNLDSLELLSDSGLTKLFPNGVLPEELDIIATSRNTPHTNIGSLAKGYLLQNLDEEAALELLRLHCEESPFNLSAPQQDDGEIIAAKELLKYLDHHAWSVEIIAGYLGQNYRYGENSAAILQRLKKDFSITAEIRSFRDIPDCTGKLLKPTVEKIAAMQLGPEILDMACAAAIFAPEMIPEKILEIFWKKQYGHLECSKPDPWKWVWETLKDYHIVYSRSDGIARMHRNTQSFFRKKGMEKHEQFAAVIDDILSETALNASEAHCISGFAQFILSQPWGNKYFLNVSGYISGFLLKWYYLSDTKALLETLQTIFETGISGEEWKTAAEHSLFENRGAYYYSSCQYEKALESYRRSAAIATAKFSEEHPAVARTYGEIVHIYLAVGNYQQALDFAQKTLKIREKTSAAPKVVSIAYNDVALCYHSMGDHVNALAFYKKSAAAAELPHTTLAAVYNNIGMLYDSTDNLEQAAEFLNKSLALHIAAREDDLQTAEVYNNLGKVCSRMGNFSEALEYLNKSLEIMVTFLPEDHPNIAFIHTNTGNTCFATGNYELALENYNKSLTIREKRLPENHLETARNYKHLGMTYSVLRNYSMAEESFRKGFAIVQSSENRSVRSAIVLQKEIQDEYQRHKKRIPLWYRVFSFIKTHCSK